MVAEAMDRSDTKNINAQLTLVKNALSKEIESQILLVENLNFGLSDIKATQEKTQVYKIIKVIIDLAFTDNGRIKDKEVTQKYIDLVAASNGEVTLSDVFFESGKPFINITIPRSDSEGDIFYIDLSSTQELLATTSVDGSYIVI